MNTSFGSYSRDKPVLITDPTKRFARSNEIINVLTKIIRYKAYDRETGLEVTWHEIHIKQSPQDQKNLMINTIERVKKIHLKSMSEIIGFWVTENQEKLFYITESLSAKSIYQTILMDDFEIKPQVIAKWFYPVLQSLDYLHALNPPLMHNRVSPQMIFIKPTSCSIKIISPSLRSRKFGMTRVSSLRLRPSTPPEFLNNDEGTYSDIWSFGLAMLYAITKEEPYSECQNPAALFQKLIKYEPPQSLNFVNDRNAQNLIASCLRTPNLRPTAAELLRHPFFSTHVELPSHQQTTLPSEEIVVIFSGKASQSHNNLPSVDDHVQLSQSSKISMSASRLIT